ncbi:restriction endonuclease subunit S [Rahnella inusitata]|uniref:restriction endonuclease subunit S n=1 Tax=Rahnella inusitata TaxID=58169 RepID=UPI0039AF50A0
MSKVPAGWEKAILSDICKKPISYGIVQTGLSVLDGVPCLRVVDLTQQSISLKNVITTSKEINDSYKKTILEKDEIVMALRGVVGLVKLISEELVGANITRGLARISPKKDKIDPEFLLWALRSPILRSELLSRVAGSALQEISLGELRKVETLIPPLPEQTKIAQILSTWDKAIATTEQLIGNSQQQKKALMQSLLTGKKRLPGFEGELINSTLGDACYINPKKASCPEGGLVSFISMDSVSEDAKLIRTEVRNYDDVEKGFTSFSDNDVLVAKITPCFENGKGAYLDKLKNGVGFGSTEFHVLRAKKIHIQNLSITLLIQMSFAYVEKPICKVPQDRNALLQII